MVIIIKNEINISYPRTKYPLLNETITKEIKTILNEFMEYAKSELEFNFTYTLDINYEEYSYNNYLSFVFYTSIYTGGAHPDNKIFTINYDILNNKIITIDDIISNDKLLTLSNESRKILMQNKNIEHDKNSKEMLVEGTKPLKNNFRNFVFSENGLIIYFEQYQIAPYSSGSFKVLIPYNKIK